MKQRIQILLITLLYCCFVSAERHYTSKYYTDNHFLILGGGAGYSMLLGNAPTLTSFGNVGGTFAFGYEYRIKRFWTNLSVELQYLSATSTFSISGTDKFIYDTQGKQALMHYDFDQSLDKQEFLFVNLPVVIGYYYRGLYLGAGAKIGYSIRAKETTALQYTTSATYQQYIDDFASMSDHFLTTYSSSVTENINSKYKLSAIAEIGYDVLTFSRKMNNSNRSGLKITVMVEYGLNNLINTNAELPLYSFNERNAAELFIHPFYNTDASQSYHIHPLYAEMRISWIFNIWTRKCTWCNLNDNHQNSPKKYKKL